MGGKHLQGVAISYYLEGHPTVHWLLGQGSFRLDRSYTERDVEWVIVVGHKHSDEGTSNVTAFYCHDTDQSVSHLRISRHQESRLYYWIMMLHMKSSLEGQSWAPHPNCVGPRSKLQVSR